MSRPALIVALARVLKRPPTPEEYESLRAALEEFCPTRRAYVPEPDPPVAVILAMRDGGATVRAIAHKLRLPRSTVGEVLVRNPVRKADAEPA